MSSCWHGQKSWEYDGGSHGWFTYHLLECLRSQTAPVNLESLVSAVATRMRKMRRLCPPAARQKPHLLLDGLPPILLPLRVGTRGLPRGLIWYCLFVAIILALTLSEGTVWLRQHGSVEMPGNKITMPSPASLRVDGWPKWNDHIKQDSTVVTGAVGGIDFADCRVALYTWSGSGWSFYLAVNPDPNNGRWSSSLKFAPSYAAILVRGTVQLEERLQQLPKEEDGILRVVRSEQ